MITFEQQLAHARALATRLCIGWLLGSDFVAHLSRRCFTTPAILTWKDLARAWHEMGHIATNSEIDPAGDVIVADWLRGGNYVANTRRESRAWGWAKANALEWNAAMQDELRRCLKSYKHRATGIADPIWQELDRIDNRLTVGHALLAEDRRAMIDRRALVDQWQLDVARQHAASPMRKYERLIDRWQKEMMR